MTRVAFWTEQHCQQNRFWLTGSELESVLQHYELERPEGLAVTEIGVGLCTVTAELAKENRVTAVDIAKPALVHAVAAGAYLGLLTEQLDAAPYADLVLAHLVFQHVASEEVLRLLEAPLKASGVYAFQTAYLLDRDDGGWDSERIVWHPREEVLELAAQAGLEPFWERTSETKFDGARVGSTAFKCRRTK